jgi:hypothetical protein
MTPVAGGMEEADQTEEAPQERLASIEARLEALDKTVATLAGLVQTGFPALGFPEPIAGALAREHASVSFHERFFHLLDAGEASIKFAAAVILGLEAANGPKIDISALYGPPIPLGIWARIVQDSYPALTAAGTPGSIFVRDHIFRRDRSLLPSAKLLLSEFVTVRNRERGHGTTHPEGIYEDLYRRHAIAIHDAIRAMDFYQIPFVRIEQINIIESTMRYDLRLLMGPFPMSRVERLESSAMVPKGEVCIWDREKSLLGLKGLVIYRACPVCNLEHTFFLEQVSGGRARYHTYTGNHRIELEAPGWIAATAGLGDKAPGSR